MAGKADRGEMSWWHFRPPVKRDIKMSRGTHLMPLETMRPALWRESFNFLRACDTAPERFQAKWRPVRVKKTRQIKNLEPRFDSIETERALVPA